MQRYSQYRSHLSKSRFGRLFKAAFIKVDKKTLIKNVILTAFVAFFGFAILFLLAYAWISHTLPDPNSLLFQDVSQTTKIYDRTGEHLLYEVSGDEKRTLITYDELPANLIDATITAEDRSFLTHNGIDLRGIARAIFSDIVHLNRAQGASTITQQLVKNAILTNERTFTRKFKEIILSLAIERNFSKEQILQMYFNEIGYGSTNYGIEAASNAYFDKSAKDLDLAECATLSAIVRQPTRYLNNPDMLTARRDWVLDGMAELGYASQADVDVAKTEDTTIIPKEAGLKTAPHFVMWVKQLLEETYPDRNIETGGLRVTTTLDYNKQTIAQDAVAYGMGLNSERYGFNNAGLVSLDPKTGEVLAMVGSADYFNDDIQGQVNVTLRPLQPGSSMKPLIYTAAFEKGYTPNTILWDVNTTYPTATGPYAPHNYDGGERGPLTMRKALQGSLNLPAVQTLYLVGVNRALDFLNRMGYTTLTDRSNYGLSLVLGGGEVELIEHARAYATLANNGTKRDIVGILKVEDSDGNVIDEFKPEEHEGERVLDSAITAITSNVLSDEASREYVFGASNLLYLSDRPIAAKTGTTNDYNDAWTMGYTPSLVAGVWVGNTDGTQMNNRADGSIVAAPIWHQYMQKALAGTAVESFPAAEIPMTGKPVLDGVMPTQTVTIDTVSGKLATEHTPERFRKTVACGEYHSILHYINKDDPRGMAPLDPSRDPYYATWEAAIADFITRHNATLKDGEVPYESCTVPTEEDDIHTPRNTPEITIKNPNNHSDVGRSFGVEYRVELHREFSRIEFNVDGTYVGSSTNMDGDIVTLPSWVAQGNHTLSATVYDDVDNNASDDVTVTVTEAGNGIEGPLITNPFSNQTIEKTSATYTISVELANAANATALTVSAKNLWTGAISEIAIVVSPSSINAVSWSLPSEAEYVISATATYNDTTTADATPVRVFVRESISGTVTSIVETVVP